MAKGKKLIKLKKFHLAKAGYQYKLKQLTEEERDALEHGKKIIVKGQPARGERPDFFYWFKFIGDVEVRIHEVGPDFYWEQAKITQVEHIAIVEQKAAEQAYWNKKIKSIPDTKPPKRTLGEIVPERASRFPDVITLQGGEFDGQKRPYNKAFAFFMEQADLGTPAEPCIKALRYKRDVNDPLLYVYDQMF